jgi:hypothetical protein
LSRGTNKEIWIIQLEDGKVLDESKYLDERGVRIYDELKQKVNKQGYCKPLKRSSLSNGSKELLAYIINQGN